ncbi:MAG: hypothetical protein JO266_06905 [Acidobacteria bacterium]|nr:hypothetical protein [Acidobacteriota bacterium]
MRQVKRRPQKAHLLTPQRTRPGNDANRDRFMKGVGVADRYPGSVAQDVAVPQIDVFQTAGSIMNGHLSVSRPITAY